MFSSSSNATSCAFEVNACKKYTRRSLLQEMQIFIQSYVLITPDAEQRLSSNPFISEWYV